MPGVRYIDPQGRRHEEEVENGFTLMEGAFMLAYQGLLVPSARWDCPNLVVFLKHPSSDINDCLSFDQSSDVNWPAWREFSAFETAA